MRSSRETVARLRIAAGCERGRWVEPSLSEETLGKRRQTSVGQIKHNTLNTMHGKENDRGSERLTLSCHRGNILKRGQLNSAQPKTFRGEREDHSPEFLTGIAQAHNH